MTGLRQHLAGAGWIALALWLAAGFGDWLCHRRTRIERTSGSRESALHLMLFLLIAGPLLAALFFEVNALLLAIMSVGVLAHFACSWCDTAYAQPKRHIAPLEQMIHSHLEMLPLFGLVIVLLLHWDTVRAPEWALVPRSSALPRATVFTVISGLLLGLGFILEELWRCSRAAHAVIDVPPGRSA
jgi:hypothetical protein